MVIGDIIVLFLAVLMAIAYVIISVVCVLTEDYLNAVAALVLYVMTIVCIVMDRRYFNKHNRTK